MDKKEYTVAERIKCGLDLRGMRAVDLSRKNRTHKVNHFSIYEWQNRT